MLANKLASALSTVINVIVAAYKLANQGAGIINIKSTNSPITLPAAITASPPMVSSFTSIFDTFDTKYGNSSTAPIKKQNENAAAPPIPPLHIIKPNTPRPSIFPAYTDLINFNLITPIHIYYIKKILTCQVERTYEKPI